jgi:CRP/FNR family transcriptional regulator
MILVTLASVTAIIFHDFLYQTFQMRREVLIMLFNLLPLLYAMNLLAVGIVNPRYFQLSIIKIPIIIDVNLKIGGRRLKTITYHVTGNNCYCKTVDPIKNGSRSTASFTCSGFSSPPVSGTAVYNSHDQQKQFSGTLVRFDKKPFGFFLFHVRYFFYRIIRGISFNLRLPGFKNIRELFVRPVSVMQREWKYNAGSVLFHQGDAGRNFYLIRKGEVEIIKTLDTGEKVLLTTLGEGDIFGEMAIVGNQPRLAEVVCKSDCLLAVAEADNLEALIDSNPIFTHKLVKNFANRLRGSEQTMLKNISDIEIQTARREKMLKSLLKLLLISAGCVKDDDSIVVNLNLDDLSRAIKLDKESIKVMLKVLSSGKGNNRSLPDDLSAFETAIDRALSRFKLKIKTGENKE